jgi:endonuclease YncB( thermonuclease family)
VPYLESEEKTISNHDHVDQSAGSGTTRPLAEMIRFLGLLAVIVAACSSRPSPPSAEVVPRLIGADTVQLKDEREVRSPERVSEKIDRSGVQRDDEGEARSLQRVSRVIDGDTVQLDDGRKLRYAGINAPEEGEPYYHEATQANNLLVGNKEVDLEFGRSKTDKHERLLAYVYVGRAFIQAEIVRQGWALVMRAQPLPRYRAILLKNQEEARDKGRGIWTRGEHRGQLAVVQVHPRESRRHSASDEYVVFMNAGRAPVDLTGWTISDEANQSYLVPQFTLGPGKSFTLYTGSGKNTDQALYWGQRKTVWNKDGDTVIVKDDTKHYVVSHTYGPKGK